MDTGTADEVRTLLGTVRDPEIPVLSIADLGILRDVQVTGSRVDVTITPTYTACPAMAQIEADIRSVLRDAGWHAHVRTQLSPAWTTDWLTPAARDQLRAYGIAAPLPACATPAASDTRSLTHGSRRVIPIVAAIGTPIATNIEAGSVDSMPAPSPEHSEIALGGVACPLCGSDDTEELARFGSTACKALYRCRSCREAFDYFKPY